MYQEGKIMKNFPKYLMLSTLVVQNVMAGYVVDQVKVLRDNLGSEVVNAGLPSAADNIYKSIFTGKLEGVFDGFSTEFANDEQEKEIIKALILYGIFDFRSNTRIASVEARMGSLFDALVAVEMAAKDPDNSLAIAYQKQIANAYSLAGSLLWNSIYDSSFSHDYVIDQFRKHYQIQSSKHSDKLKIENINDIIQVDKMIRYFTEVIKENKGLLVNEELAYIKKNDFNNMNDFWRSIFSGSAVMGSTNEFKQHRQSSNRVILAKYRKGYDAEEERKKVEAANALRDRQERERQRQEQLRQEQLRQEQLRQEQLRQERQRQEQLRQEQLRQEQLRQEQLRQERQRQEQLRQEQLRQEQLRQEQLRQEQLRQEQLKQEQLRQEQDAQRKANEKLQKELGVSEKSVNAIQKSFGTDINNSLVKKTVKLLAGAFPGIFDKEQNYAASKIKRFTEKEYNIISKIVEKIVWSANDSELDKGVDTRDAIISSINLMVKAIGGQKFELAKKNISTYEAYTNYVEAVKFVFTNRINGKKYTNDQRLFLIGSYNDLEGLSKTSKKALAGMKAIATETKDVSLLKDKYETIRKNALSNVTNSSVYIEKVADLAKLYSLIIKDANNKFSLDIEGVMTEFYLKWNNILTKSSRFEKLYDVLKDSKSISDFELATSIANHFKEKIESISQPGMLADNIASFLDAVKGVGKEAKELVLKNKHYEGMEYHKWLAKGSSLIPGAKDDVQRAISITEYFADFVRFIGENPKSIDLHEVIFNLFKKFPGEITKDKFTDLKPILVSLKGSGSLGRISRQLTTFSFKKGLNSSEFNDLDGAIVYIKKQAAYRQARGYKYDSISQQIIDKFIDKDGNLNSKLYEDFISKLDSAEQVLGNIELLDSADTTLDAQGLIDYIDQTVAKKEKEAEIQDHNSKMISTALTKFKGKDFAKVQRLVMTLADDTGKVTSDTYDEFVAAYDELANLIGAEKTLKKVFAVGILHGNNTIGKINSTIKMAKNEGQEEKNYQKHVKDLNDKKYQKALQAFEKYFENDEVDFKYASLNKMIKDFEYRVQLSGIDKGPLIEATAALVQGSETNHKVLERVVLWLAEELQKAKKEYPKSMGQVIKALKLIESISLNSDKQIKSFFDEKASLIISKIAALPEDDADEILSLVRSIEVDERVNALMTMLNKPSVVKIYETLADNYKKVGGKALAFEPISAQMMNLSNESFESLTQVLEVLLGEGGRLTENQIYNLLDKKWGKKGYDTLKSFLEEISKVDNKSKRIRFSDKVDMRALMVVADVYVNETDYSMFKNFNYALYELIKEYVKVSEEIKLETLLPNVRGVDGVLADDEFGKGGDGYAIVLVKGIKEQIKKMKNNANKDPQKLKETIEFVANMVPAFTQAIKAYSKPESKALAKDTENLKLLLKRIVRQSTDGHVSLSDYADAAFDVLIRLNVSGYIAGDHDLPSNVVNLYYEGGLYAALGHENAKPEDIEKVLPKLFTRLFPANDRLELIAVGDRLIAIKEAVKKYDNNKDKNKTIESLVEEIEKSLKDKVEEIVKAREYRRSLQ